MCLITPNRAGFLKPCGCDPSYTEPNSSQDLGAIKQLRTKFESLGYVVTCIDAGNLFDNGGLAPLILKCYEKSGYNLVNFTRKDHSCIDKQKLFLESVKISIIGSAGGKKSPSYLREGLHVESLKRDAIRKDFMDASHSDLFLQFGESDEEVPSVSPAARHRLAIVEKISSVSTGNAKFDRQNVIIYPARHEILIVKSDGSTLTRSRVSTSPLDHKDPITEALLESEAPSASIVFRAKTSSGGSNSNLQVEPAGRCRECHQDIYRDWAKTSHAKAYADLVAKNQVTEECIGCHSTAFQAAVKPQFVDIEVIKEGVSCASCHGSGVQHSATRAKSQISKRPSAGVCITCHTKERSSQFNFDQMIKKVGHTK